MIETAGGGLNREVEIIPLWCKYIVLNRDEWRGGVAIGMHSPGNMFPSVVWMPLMNKKITAFRYFPSS